MITLLCLIVVWFITSTILIKFKYSKYGFNPVLQDFGVLGFILEDLLLL
jgi:hypothetical protein